MVLEENSFGITSTYQYHGRTYTDIDKSFQDYYAQNGMKAGSYYIISASSLFKGDTLVWFYGDQESANKMHKTNYRSYFRN